MKVPVRLTQGSTYRLRVALENDDGSPVAVAGLAIRAQFRDSYGGTLRHECTLANGGVDVEPAGLWFDLVIPASDTASLPVGGGVYDLELTTTNGEVCKPFSGGWTCFPEVTT